MTRRALEREARLLTRHLLGAACPDDVLEAYVAAHGAAGDRSWQRRPDSASAFALAHPLAVGVIDAAGAVTGRAPVLRAKLLLMAAILETTPAFADAFLPRRSGTLATLGMLGWQGARTALACLAGLPLVIALGNEPS